MKTFFNYLLFSLVCITSAAGQTTGNFTDLQIQGRVVLRPMAQKSILFYDSGKVSQSLKLRWNAATQHLEVNGNTSLGVQDGGTITATNGSMAGGYSSGVLNASGYGSRVWGLVYPSSTLTAPGFGADASGTAYNAGLVSSYGTNSFIRAYTSDAGKAWSGGIGSNVFAVAARNGIVRGTGTGSFINAYASTTVGSGALDSSRVLALNNASAVFASAEGGSQISNNSPAGFIAAMGHSNSITRTGPAHASFAFISGYNQGLADVNGEGSMAIGMTDGATDSLYNAANYSLIVGKNLTNRGVGSMLFGTGLKNTVANRFKVGWGADVLTVTPTEVSVGGQLGATGAILSQSYLYAGTYLQTNQMYLTGGGGWGTAGQVLISNGGANNSWADLPPEYNFANADFFATGNRAHNWAGYDFSIFNLRSLNFGIGNDLLGTNNAFVTGLDNKFYSVVGNAPTLNNFNSTPDAITKNFITGNENSITDAMLTHILGSQNSVNYTSDSYILGKGNVLSGSAVGNYIVGQNAWVENSLANVVLSTQGANAGADGYITNVQNSNLQGHANVLEGFNHSTIIGENNQVNGGDKHYMFGEQNYQNNGGHKLYTIGGSNENAGDRVFLMGLANISVDGTNRWSGAFGFNNKIGDQTMGSKVWAFGTSNRVNGTQTYALGHANYVNGTNSVVIGKNMALEANYTVRVGVDDGSNESHVDVTPTKVTATGAFMSKINYKEGDPDTTEIPDGYSAVYHDVSNDRTYLWTNIGGTLKRVELN